MKLIRLSESFSPLQSSTANHVPLFYLYLFLILPHSAAPMNPKNNPLIENIHVKKFNVNVDGITRIMINKWMIQPRNNRIKPTVRRRRGEFISLSCYS